MSDADLLERYVQTQSDETFKALIDQYLRLVYSFCHRQLHDEHLAEDATQAVFLLLSQKAVRLRQAWLSGWLLTTARYACANIKKTEQRREHRQRVAAMKETQSPAEPDRELLGLLDEALAHLTTADREAVILRYYQDQPLRQVGQTLGVSEEAARKRVDRGIDKLRRFLARRGIVTSSIALAAMLPQHARAAALSAELQATLTQNILQSCHVGGTPAAAIAKGVNTMMLIAKLKTVAAAMIGVVILLGSVWTISLLAQQPAAEVSSPQPPASNVALDLSSPEKTLDSYISALKASDGPKAYTCLAFTADAPQSASHSALISLELAKNHLIRSANRAYGAAGADAGKGGVLADFLQLISGMNKLQHVPPTITGDIATLTINFPDFVIAHASPEHQAIMRQWNGKSINFKKQTDQWKIAGPHLDVQILLTDASKKLIEDRATQVAAFKEYAQLDEQLAAEIDNHQYATWNDAHKARNERLKTILAKYHAAEIDCQVLPPK